MNVLTEKLQRSWELFKRSIRVIRDNPKLLVFPIATAILTLGIALFFLLPVGLLLVAPHWIESGMLRSVADSIGFARVQSGSRFNFEIQPVGTAILAILYLINMFLATMASVAFNSEILQALSGQPVSLRHGVRVACGRWKAVLLWSLLAGVVGLIIRAIEERFAFVGRLVAGLIGLAWSVAAIFAIPIIVRDPAGANPFEVLTKSANTIKRTWGEMLAGFVGMRGANAVVLLASVFFWLATGLAAYLISPWVILAAGVPWFITLAVYSYLASVASKVYLCALYLYATEGVVPGPYDEQMMQMAWKVKKGSQSA